MSGKCRVIYCLPLDRRVPEFPDQPKGGKPRNRQNLTSLAGRFDTSTPLALTSDHVALTTFQYQTRMTDAFDQAGEGGGGDDPRREAGYLPRPAGLPLPPPPCFYLRIWGSGVLTDSRFPTPSWPRSPLRIRTTINKAGRSAILIC